MPAGAAAGTPLDAEAQAELRRMRVPEDQIAAGVALRGPEDADAGAPRVWPWHMDAARVFGAMRRQWRVVMGQKGLIYLGLDLNALAEVRRHLRIKAGPQLLDQLRTMEAAAADALNKG